LSNVLKLLTNPPTLSLVVPVYNEEERLGESFSELTSFVASYPSGSELIIADDGSVDGTVTLANELISRHRAGHFVRVVQLAHRGKGGAIRAGMEQARGDYLAFCDVDLSTPLPEIERLLAIAMLGDGLAIGSRDVVTSHRIVRESPVREFFGRAYNRLVRAVVTPGVFDTQCGAKVASGAIWGHLLPLTRQNGFAWDVEVIAVAKRLNFAVWEVGVQWSHDERTKVRPVLDGFAMVREVASIWANVQRIDSLVGKDHVIKDLSACERTRRSATIIISDLPAQLSVVTPSLVERAV
jgi:dolichyl-phosphate beta-glucosyltransferase